MSYLDDYKKAQKGKTIKSMTTELLKWTKKGQEVVGMLISKVQIESKKEGQRDYMMYHVKTDEKIVKFALGAIADADIGGQLEAGKVYVFAYEGKEPLKDGKEFNKFFIAEIPSLSSTREDIY